MERYILIWVYLLRKGSYDLIKLLRSVLCSVSYYLFLSFVLLYERLYNGLLDTC